MTSWIKNHPLPWLVACFILGILTADRLSFAPLPSLFLTFLIFLLLLKKADPRFALLLFFSLGFVWASFQFLPVDGDSSCGDRLSVFGVRKDLSCTSRSPMTDHRAPQQGSFELIITGPMQFVRNGIRVAADFLEPAESSHERRRLPTRLIVYQGVPKLRSGDVVRVWGRRIPVKGFRNPGARDPVRQAQREGIATTVRVDRAEAVIVTGRLRGVWPFRSLEGLRYEMRAFLMFAPTSGLIRALILGDRSGLSEELTESFREAGLSHLLAISGQHVGLVALLFFLLFRGLLSLFPTLGLWVPLQKIAWVLAVFPAAAYVGLAGCPVSAIRALIFLLVFVVAFVMSRSRHLWTTLALAALIILLLDPSSLFSVSFLLSFTAVAALILFVPKLGRGLWSWALSLLLTSAVVTVMVAPLLAYYFQAVPLAGVLANIIAVPLLGFVVLPLAMLTVIASLLWPSAGTWLLPIATQSTDLLAQLAAWFAAFELSVPFSLRPIQVVLCYGALAVFCIWYLVKGIWSKRVLAVAILFVILLGTEQFSISYFDSQKLRMTLLDVGHGDAIVLSLPGNYHYLIDGGGFHVPRDVRRFETSDIGERVIMPFLRRHGISKLEGMVLSHPHPDHYEGFISVTRQTTVNNFYWNGDRFPDSSFEELLQLLGAQHVKLIQVDASAEPIIHGDVRIRWLNPSRDREDSLNNRSIVMRVDYQDTCLLLTGDIERTTEFDLLRDGLAPCDVLKVPHHGSRTSSTRPFLDAVDPHYAVVSASAHNTMGLPHPLILERYQERDIPLWRTDRHGAISVVSDGKDIKIETAVRP